MKNAAEILRFLVHASARGERTVLITLTGISGGSPRTVGTHMAVSETGAYAGSISGGCVEAAIIGEAKRVIASGRAEQLRLGEGSPFMDIRLPCGGGIDILMTPISAIECLRDASNWLAARKSVLFLLKEDGSLATRLAQTDDPTGWQRGAFQVRHDPDLRLVIAGHGAEALALARFGLAYNSGVTLLSPHEDLIESAAKLGAEVWMLRSRQRSEHFVADRHSAVVLLFHDHDWELELLIQALEQPAFFVGAMGSRTTHRRRLNALAERGVPQSALDRLIGPIGLIGMARDPDTLALSAMAQIISVYYGNDKYEQRSLTQFVATTA